jgi:hypothetical protein
MDISPGSGQGCQGNASTLAARSYRSPRDFELSTPKDEQIGVAFNWPFSV